MPRIEVGFRALIQPREPNLPAGRTSISAILSRASSGGKLNDYLLSLILGIVEGLTEFLPVSSTAHLRISEVLLHISLGDPYWKMYTIVIQLGAILCLPVYFRERIAKFLSTFPTGENGDRTALTHPLGLTLVAFVVTAIPAFLMTKIIGKHLESLTIMGTSLVVGGIIMWMVDARNAPSEAAGPSAPPGRIHTWKMEAMSLGQAIWIGACQILSAVFPGASRSMSTIAAGQLAGMSRASALEFSFFLSIPTMVAATGYDLLKSVMGKGQNPIGVAQIDAHGWIVLAIGFVVSFIVAYGSVAWFMAWVRKHGFVPFAIYRLIVGTLVLIFLARAGA
jgi:undecaprenyl-diphosphatase